LFQLSNFASFENLELHFLVSFFQVTRICLISDIHFVDGDREGEARRTEFNLKLEFRRKITETGDGVRPVINLRGLLTGNLAQKLADHRTVGSPGHHRDGICLYANSL